MVSTVFQNQFHFTFEQYNLLGHGEDACQPDKDYSMDRCLQDGMKRQMVESFGCGVPFLPNMVMLTCQEQRYK